MGEKHAPNALQFNIAGFLSSPFAPSYGVALACCVARDTIG